MKSTEGLGVDVDVSMGVKQNWDLGLVEASKTAVEAFEKSFEFCFYHKLHKDTSIFSPSWGGGAKDGPVACIGYSRRPKRVPKRGSPCELPRM